MKELIIELVEENLRLKEEIEKLKSNEEKVVFKISGSDLVSVLEKQTKPKKPENGKSQL